MGTRFDKLLKNLNDENVLSRIEVYDLLGEHPCEETLILLWDAIEREKNELARAYVISLWAENNRALEYDMEKALTSICELERQEEIKQSEYCMSSCYYAEYLFGNQAAIKQIDNILDRSDERVQIGIRCLLEDMKNS